jgi:hypothetical protein
MPSTAFAPAADVEGATALAEFERAKVDIEAATRGPHLPPRPRRHGRAKARTVAAVRTDLGEDIGKPNLLRAPTSERHPRLGRCVAGLRCEAFFAAPRRIPTGGGGESGPAHSMLTDTNSQRGRSRLCARCACQADLGAHGAIA